MHVIMMGCKYAGKTTLGAEICKWMEENMGPGQYGYGWHDHFVVPYLTHPGDDQEIHAEQIESMAPTLLQQVSNHSVEYHFAMLEDDDFLAIDWYYGDVVYAPLYYGYGKPGEYADVRLIARINEAKIKKVSPDTVLVLVKASPEVIRQRKLENPHPRCILKDEDVETVLDRFEEQYSLSCLRRKIELDTTEATVEETLKEFLRKMEGHFTVADRLAILTHAHLKPTLYG